MIVTNAAAELEPSDQQARRSWFRFSLKTMLLLMALVAVYLGGRASMAPNRSVPSHGTWQLIMPSGYQQPVTLYSLQDGTYSLNMGSNSCLGGKYKWKSGQLIVQVPDDNRYMGLTWQWEGDDLLLVAEPPSHPSGGVYLGARLRFVSPDTSAETQQTVPVVPSRFAVERSAR
jgi:hypothetical protein